MGYAVQSMRWFGLLLLLLVLMPPPVMATQAGGLRCFSETGYCINGPLAAFWETNGGLPVFGLPISPLVETSVEGQPLRLQWFERARLEVHTEQPGPAIVQLGRLGVEALTASGRDWHSFERGTTGSGCRSFSATGHPVCEPILSAWQAQGLQLDNQPALSDDERSALFGLPLSSLRTERLSDGQLYQVQWFERARFEIHLESGQPKVLLGLLGQEVRPAQLERVRPVFAPEACPFRVPAGARVECGKLMVPLERTQPGGRSAAVAVAIFRDPHPRAEPILYLAGGPGSPALESAAVLWQSWQAFIAGRDFVVVDQRGVGASWPTLRCPEVPAFAAEARRQQLRGQRYAQGEAAALRACSERLAAEGTPMRAFTTAAAAADLEDLRQTLGMPAWNVFGISYGTRLAMALVRDYPGGVRSLILDSPYPLQVSLYASMPANLDRALTTLFSDCAAHPQCAVRYPDLEARFWRLVEGLNANPLSAELGAGPEPLSGDRLIGIVFRQLYATRSLPKLPAALVGVEQGNLRPLRELIASRASVGVGTSQALYYAVQCAEEFAALGPGWREQALAGRQRLAGFYSGLLELSGEAEGLCAHFGAASFEPRWVAPLRAETPVLVLSGAYDPITPPAWRERVAEGLGRTYSFVLPGTGHAAISRGRCATSLVRAFLVNPLQAPDGSCVAQLGPPAFE